MVRRGERIKITHAELRGSARGAQTLRRACSERRRQSIYLPRAPRRVQPGKAHSPPHTHSTPRRSVHFNEGYCIKNYQPFTRRRCASHDCVEFFMRPMAVLITRGSFGWKLMSSRAMCVCYILPLRTNGFFQFPFAAVYVQG